MSEEIKLSNPELDLLLLNKDSGYNYRQRRHENWDVNYTLYRDTVLINRLLQRQTVNLPLMKKIVRTLLKDVDDMPVMEFQNLDNDKQAELFKNDYWKWTGDQNRFELQDIIDKRQMFLNGRSFDSWQIVNGKVKMTVEDTFDILVDRYIEPHDLHTSSFLIHTHIFKPLRKLKQNKDYNQKAVADLEKWYATQEGLVKVAENHRMLQEKNQRLSDMGMPDTDNPKLGETVVELSLHFAWRDNEKDDQGNVMEDQIFLYVEADNQQILMKKPLEEVMGVTKDHFFRTHYPYCTWADDLERLDFWSDSIADIVRQANVVLNSWWSQEVENRTLKNFNMHYYDSTAEGMDGFQPNTMNPVPWGWYGLPGDPNVVMKDVTVSDLSDSIKQIEFLITFIENATGATATLQGAPSERQITLGEVKLSLVEAKERIKGMSKFYTQAWKDRGVMFDKICEAGADKLDSVKLWKKGRNTTNFFGRQISPTDWMTENGYTVKVWSQDEKDSLDTMSLQKLAAARQMMPGNPKLDEIYKRKMLEWQDLTPEEIKEIMDFERQKQEALLSAQSNSGMMGGTMPPTAGAVPGQLPQLPASQPQQGAMPMGQ